MAASINAPLHIAGDWDVYPPRGGAKTRVLRALKHVLYVGYLYSGWIQVRDAVLSLLGRSRVVILYYHRVGWIDRLSKPRSHFRADLAYLQKHYECVTMRQLVARMKSGEPIRRKLAVVTFDDGYLDNYLSAFPELVRARVPATFFVTTGYIGTQRKFPHDTRALEAGISARDDWAKMTWDQLREMQAAGMEIGSHTVNHANLRHTDEVAMKEELTQSLATLTQELGERERPFCFPWGTPDAFSGKCCEQARLAGYYAAVTTCPGEFRRRDDLYQLRRIDVGNGQFSRLGTMAAIEGLGCGWLARCLRRLLK